MAIDSAMMKNERGKGHWLMSGFLFLVIQTDRDRVEAVSQTLSESGD